MIDLYQSDPATFSDEELKTLSDELEEEYCYQAMDGDEWSDDAADARHTQLNREINRRWSLAHPDYKHPSPSEFVRAILAAFHNSAMFARAVDMEFRFPFEGSKTGDTLTVRDPRRFTVSQ